jgi:hypothetical protein
MTPLFSAVFFIFMPLINPITDVVKPEGIYSRHWAHLTGLPGTLQLQLSVRKENTRQ